MSFGARKDSLSLQSEVGEGKDRIEVSGTPHAVRVFYDHPEKRKLLTQQGERNLKSTARGRTKRNKEF